MVTKATTTVEEYDESQVHQLDMLVHIGDAWMLEEEEEEEEMDLVPGVASRGRYPGEDEGETRRRRPRRRRKRKPDVFTRLSSGLSCGTRTGEKEKAARKAARGGDGQRTIADEQQAVVDDLEELMERYPISDGRQGTLDKLLCLAGSVRPGTGNDHIIHRVRTIIDKLHNNVLTRRAEYHRRAIVNMLGDMPEVDHVIDAPRTIGGDEADAHRRAASSRGRHFYTRGGADEEGEGENVSPTNRTRVRVRRHVGAHSPVPVDSLEHDAAHIADEQAADARAAAAGRRARENGAASRIQASFRGYRQRTRYVEHRDARRTLQQSRERRSATKIQSSFRGFAARRELARRREAYARAHPSVAEAGIQVDDGSVPRAPVSDEASFSAEQAAARRSAATRLQANYRGYRTRRDVGETYGWHPTVSNARNRRRHDEAACLIQRRYRGVRGRRLATALRPSLQAHHARRRTAATRVQALYRGSRVRRSSIMAETRTAKQQHLAARRIAQWWHSMRQRAAARQAMDDAYLQYYLDREELYDEMRSVRLASVPPCLLAANWVLKAELLLNKDKDINMDINNNMDNMMMMEYAVHLGEHSEAQEALYANYVADKAL